MNRKRGFIQKSRDLILCACVFLLLPGCANMSYKQKAFWEGATVGAIIATPAAAIATAEQDEDDRHAAAVIGMVAGGLIGGVVGLMNAKEPVVQKAVAEPPPAPKMEVLPPKMEEKPMVAKREEVPVQQEVVAERTPPPPVEMVKEKIVLRGINFDFDKYSIKGEFIPVLDEAARILNNRKEVSVEIAGHTCWVGTDAYNQKLSEKRAHSVYDFLVNKGVGSDRLSVVGYGEKQPVADNHTVQGRRMNRRVEFLIMDK